MANQILLWKSIGFISLTVFFTILYVYSTTQTRVQNRNWVILVAVNKGYMDFFLNWYISFKKLNIPYPVIVMTEDDDSYNTLQRYHSHKLQIDRNAGVGIRNATRYRSDDFLKLVARRPTHILKYLKGGFNVLYVDTDTVWLKNPFFFFVGNFDICLARGDPWAFNTGLIGVINNKKTVRLMKMWEAESTHKAQTVQKAFNSLHMLKDLKILVLESRNFPTGFMLFGTRKEAKIPEEVVVVHNNGLPEHDEKLERFKVNNLWFLKKGIENVLGE